MKYIFSHSYEQALVKEADYASGNWRSKSFNDCFARLPVEVQKAAKMNYNKLLANPQAVGLKTMPQTPGSYQVYSAQIGRAYRALAIKVESYYIWYWIGTHEEYNNVKAKTPPASAAAMAQNILRHKGQQKMKHLKSASFNKKAQFGTSDNSGLPPTPPIPPPTPPVPQSPSGNNGKPCPNCQATMVFDDGNWYCESCNELLSVEEGKCPKCGVGDMGEFERGETDAWDWGSESHYTRPSNSESRFCDNCGYREDRDWEDPRNDPDAAYDRMKDDEAVRLAEEEENNRGLGGVAGNYFNLKKIAQSKSKKIAQFSGDEEFGDDITSGLPNDFERHDMDEKCQGCRQTKPDVEARNSYGIYAGKFCCDCAYSKYRDHCGLIKNHDGTYSDGNQGDTRELEDMGEQVEPEDGGFFR